MKSLRLVSVDAVELDETGVRGDRRFYLIDDAGDLAIAKRMPRLLAVRAEIEDVHLRLRFPDGTSIEGDVELAERVETSFFGRPVTGRVVTGPWSNALSEFAGVSLHLVRTDRRGDGFDRGPRAAASLVSTGSLEALRRTVGDETPIDGRRFRMTIGVDAEEPHVEDGWIGARVRLGEAAVVVRDRIARCAVTTRDPDTGVRDLDALGAIAEYRGDVPKRVPLPFGVWCEVVEPGRVAVGDAVEVD